MYMYIYVQIVQTHTYNIHIHKHACTSYSMNAINIKCNIACAYYNLHHIDILVEQLQSFEKRWLGKVSSKGESVLSPANNSLHNALCILWHFTGMVLNWILCITHDLLLPTQCKAVGTLGQIQTLLCGRTVHRVSRACYAGAIWTVFWNPI